MNILRTRKRFLAFFAVLALLIALPVILYVQRQEQETRSKAAAATTLAFTLPSPQVHVGDTVSIDIQLTPGNNLVTFLKLHLIYDATKFSDVIFTPDPNGFPATNEGPLIQNGTVMVSLSVGNDPTRAISTPTRIGTLTLKAIAAGTTNFSFGDQTQALSADSGSEANENVYSGGTPVTLTITNPPCSLPTPPSGNAEYYDTTLAGSNEVPPNNSPASGRARAVVNTNGTVSVMFCYEGLTAINNDAGIHFAPPGQTAPETLNLPASANTHYDDTASGGIMISVVPTWLQNLRNGIWYINVSSLAFPNGEIRGQFGTYVAPTPTPTSVASVTPIPPTPTRTPTPIVATTTQVPPTPTLAASTSTPAPLQTQLSFTAFLHGIGKSGDSANETSFALSNQNPLHTQRGMRVQLFDVNNVLVHNMVFQGNMNYNPTDGNFKGSLVLNSIPDGVYTMKIGSDKYLTKKIPGIITLHPGQNNVIPTITFIAGDADKSNDLFIFDYNIIYGCYSVDAPPRACDATLKEQADINDDGKVDQFDYNLFLRELSNRAGD